MPEFFARVLDGIATGIRYFSFLGVLFAWTKLISGAIAEVTAKVAEMVLHECGFPTFSFFEATGGALDLEVINAFVPLQEGWSLLSCLLLLFTIVVFIRWLKSLIPTVSN